MKRYQPKIQNDLFKKPDISMYEFKEAVYRTDKYSKRLYNYLLKIFKENKESNLKYDKQICEFLSNKFSKYNIIFVDSGENKDNGIISGINDMETGSNSLLIKINCSLKIDKIFKDINLQKLFLIDFKSLISHELVHRAQYIKIQDTKLQKNIIKFIRNKTGLAYYSQKEEIMSYACQIVEELRLKGMKDSEILLFIQNRQSYENIQCNTYDFYKKYYNNSNVFSRLLKYIYEYIKGDLNKNIVKIGS